MDISAYLQAFLEKYKPYKDAWNYEDGCVLLGCIDLYRATGEEAYRAFVLRYLENRVTPDGDIPSFGRKQYNIDSINCGKALFFAYAETGDERYRKAIELHRQVLGEHPRCECGNFWHKSIYPNQVWLDGLYMAQPFYLEYELRYDRMAAVGDIAAQFQNVRRYLYDEDKGLYYHAWDEQRVQPWANKATGLSRNFWLRSMGWYLMALVDCLEIMDEQLFEHYKTLETLFKEAVRGILRYRDERTGLFYQVIDHPEHPDNYLETSGSAMVAYALMKGARIGALNAERYAPLGEETFDNLVRLKLTEDDDGVARLHDICWMAGLGPGEKRDGSVEYYLSEKRVSDDSKGVGPFMMAYSERLLLNR